MGKFWSTGRDGRSLCGQRISIHEILKDDGSTDFLCGPFDKESRRIEESESDEEELSPCVRYVHKPILARMEDVSDLLNEILGSSPRDSLYWISTQFQDDTDCKIASVTPGSSSTRAVRRLGARKLILNMHFSLADLLSANSSFHCSYSGLSLLCFALEDNDKSQSGVLLFDVWNWKSLHKNGIIVALLRIYSHQSEYVILKHMLSLRRLMEGNFLTVKMLIGEDSLTTFVKKYFFGKVESNMDLDTCIRREKISMGGELLISDGKFIAKCTSPDIYLTLGSRSNDGTSKLDLFGCHETAGRTPDNEHLPSFRSSRISKIIDRSSPISEFLARIYDNRKIDLPLPICIESHPVIRAEVYTHFENCDVSNAVLIRSKSKIDKLIDFLICKLDKNLPDASVTTEVRRLSERPVIDRDYIDMMQESKRTWFKLVKILVKHSVDVNIKDDEGNLLLHHLSAEKLWPDKSGMDRIARKLVKAGAKVDAKNKLGLTPLHSAVISGYHKVVEVFLKHEADVNATTNEKFFTPIHFAVAEKYLVGRDFPIIDSLLKNGANLESRTIDQETALHLCITKKIMYSEVVQEENPWEDYYLIKYLLNLGCDVDAKNANGQTPLHLACQLDCEKTIEELLRHGANINIEDQFGLPPLLYRKDEWTAAKSILTSHLMKLIAAGFYVSEKNRIEVLRLESTYEHLSVLKEKYLKELKFMKGVKIDNHTLLYDILFKETHDMARYVKNKEFTRFLFQPTRSVYHYRKFLNLQYKRGCVRRILIISGKKVLRSAVRSVLPDSCIENVIRQLSDQDLSAITTGHAVFTFRKQYTL